MDTIFRAHELNIFVVHYWLLHFDVAVNLPEQIPFSMIYPLIFVHG